MDLEKALIRRVLVPVAERIKRWPVRRYLRQLQESEWWSRDQLRELQEQKLRTMIRHAYDTAPFYRQLMDARKLQPDDIRTTDDLRKLPIVTKELIRASFPDGIVSSLYNIGDLIQLASSGSTGEPFKLVVSQDEQARRWATQFRNWAWGGYNLGERYINIGGFPHRAFKHRPLLRKIEERISFMTFLSAFELHAGNAEEYISRVTAFRPRMIYGYSSSLYYLAQVMQERGASLRLKCISTTGETLFPFQREPMESFYGCKVYDSYGGETMVVANQCGHGNTYHVNAESVIVEVVDADGNRCPPGVAGQVVLTDLNHFSMPFIRYNIQDVAVLSDRKCECGRQLPVMERIEGRLTDIGITPSGKSLVVHFFTGLFESYPVEVDSFQAVQESADHLVLTIVPGKGLDQVEGQILRRTQEYVGQDVRVEIRRQDSIPLGPGGKRRLFVSRSGMKAAGL